MFQTILTELFQLLWDFWRIFFFLQIETILKIEFGFFRWTIENISRICQLISEGFQKGIWRGFATPGFDPAGFSTMLNGFFFGGFPGLSQMCRSDSSTCSSSIFSNKLRPFNVRILSGSGQEVDCNIWPVQRDLLI